MPAELIEGFTFEFVRESHRRLIEGVEVVLHCHHYNSRIQRTIESARGIDGRALFTETAEAVFHEYLRRVLDPSDDEAARWARASALYSHLGFGVLDFSRVDDLVVDAPSSHFAEGWRAGFPNSGRPVCSLACGYIQAAVHAVRGTLVRATEVRCALTHDGPCRFTLDPDRTEPIATPTRVGGRRDLPPVEGLVTSPRVDTEKILGAVASMPLTGQANGLVPAFNVYLASTPADFYNIVCLRFVEEMERIHLGDTARELLIADAENCGMNTFRGIMASAEWDALVAPMIEDDRDRLLAIVAVSNALGWGNWQPQDYVAGERLTMRSHDSYESDGALTWQGHSHEPACLMLTGVAAGIMQLVHGVGPIEERFGQFRAEEPSCCACGDDGCRIEVEADD